jgi:hypothetical protein
MLVENEFAKVSVEVRDFGNGQRLLIRDVRTGMAFTLDPLELEGLAWARVEDLERFANPALNRRWIDDAGE